MENINEFSIDRKNSCIDFKNGYWFPIEYFSWNRNKHNGEHKFLSEGLFHLSHKRWISEDLFNEIHKFCIKEFPLLDFSYTLNYIKEYNDNINEMFKR